MQQERTSGTFEQVVLPHLDAAYNLARWLLPGKKMPKTSFRKHASALSTRLDKSGAGTSAAGC